MALLIAPYNNAMRLGQGFNTYLQQVCIDDAVIIDPQRDENVVNNAGLTMRMLAEQMGAPTALQRLPGLVPSAAALPTSAQTEAYAPASIPAPAPAAPPPPSSFSIAAAAQRQEDAAQRQKMQTGAVLLPTSAPPPTAQSDPGKKPKTAQEENKEKREAAARNAASLKAMSTTEMDGVISGFHNRTDEKIKKAVQDVTGTGRVELPWSAADARGPGQIVQYTSKFVNKISEITDDMSIAGSLSIKYNGIQGSGAGAFLDAEKFFDSDLKYFISVKVINQTINYKDALLFNPIRSCMNDDKKFNEVFGNTFISGFLEGGEFNAIVLMKVHNKNKMRDIKAEAKVALTAGPVEVSAEGNVKLAEENITNNTETTIYVRWCGGGNIKPYDDEWTIDSVKSAAARFPALVGLFPQRTYAVLSKYENLRSYLELKPARLTPLRYEVAQLYTNQIADAFLEYKALMKRLSTDIADIQAGLKEVKEPVTRVPIPATLEQANLNAYFKPSLTGLDDARRAIRTQLNILTAEVDDLTTRPELACDPHHKQPYISPALFSILLPEVSVRDSRRRPNAAPLDVPRINNVGDKSAVESAPVDTQDGDAPPLFNALAGGTPLSADEQAALAELEWQSYGIGATYQVTLPRGDPADGAAFSTLRYAQSGETVTEIAALADASGRLGSLVIGFSNGLIFTFGRPVDQEQLDRAPPAQKLADLDPKEERIVSGSMQVLTTANSDGTTSQRVVGITLVVSSNRSLSLVYQPAAGEARDILSAPIAAPSSGFKLAGLWGRMKDDETAGYIARLGCVWGPAASDKNEKPRLVESQADSVFWAKLGEPGKVKLKKPLPGRTLMLVQGVHYLRSSGTDRIDALQLGLSVDRAKMTAEAFELAVTTRKKEDTLLCYWMVVPEMPEVVVVCGEMAIDISRAPGPFRLDFPRTFAEDEPPVVRCWFTELDVSPPSPGGMVHARASVEPDSATQAGCQLRVEALGGCTLRKAKLCWIAHRRPPGGGGGTANADLVTGELRVRCAEAKPKRELALDAKLASAPVARFLAIHEVQLETRQAPSFTATFLPETSKDAVHLDVGPLAGSPVHTLGVTWILSV